MIQLLAFPFIDVIKRFQRGRLRHMIRGYQSLRRSGQLDRITMVKQVLTECPLNLTNLNFSPILMGQGSDSGEIIVRQYLLIRIGGFNLNRALLRALGSKRNSVVFPLPNEWRNILKKHGFKVANIRSAVLWQFYVLALLLYGVVRIGKISFAGISFGRNAESQLKPYAYFVDLVHGNLPQERTDTKSYDVISWYLQRFGKAKNIEVVQHSVARALPVIVGGVEVFPCQGPLPSLMSTRAVCDYVLWGFHASLIAAVDCLRGRWWHALLLNQSALASQVRNLPEGSLAQEYLFHNSCWIYRPLWTYEAERRGSAIIFYFYSTNTEDFKRSSVYPPIPYGWKAMTWPRYLVWDKYQADFVRRSVRKSVTISVVGPIWFECKPLLMPQIKKPGIAVFDVTPQRLSSYCTFGIDYEFYIPRISKMFLEHIADKAQQADILMLWKGKRRIGSRAHPNYRQFAGKLSERSNVVTIDPDISALRLIESSCAVISMPFTSTALIARALGKPSIYYDPTGELQRDDRAAHGIEVIRGPEELRHWFFIMLPKIKAANASLKCSSIMTDLRVLG